VLLLYSAALASAQQPKSDPGADRVLTETRKLLQAFGGTWSVSETYDPSYLMPQGGTGKGQETWRAGPGKRSVMEEYRSANEHGSVSTGLGLGWWEEESGGFRLNWCSNDNPHGCTRLSQLATWDGDTWVVRDTWRQNGQDVEFVTVSAERPLIDAVNGDASTTIIQKEVEAVPNPGNDLTYIAQTAPGMVMNTDQGVGNFSNLGLPAVSNLFTLNGMSYNFIGPSENSSGALNMLLGQNQVQEATVVSNGYSGQFGNVAGANVNYITKSGGNNFHGNAAYFWNGRILNAND
jgi:hypothetical protein